MKIETTTPFVELSSTFEEKSFGVGDMGMIFDILRNKMYSNSIYAVCREISANARDAHREVGKAGLPISVQLPSSFDKSLRIKDFGPGISPDRMENVYIKYANSSKRADNTQQGGFGLGAKSVFSYVDAFCITTIVDGIKYNYSCYIDETKVGKLAQLDKTPTDEPNGTEIIIPVETKDISAFRQWMEFSTKHWEVKPEFVGNRINYYCPDILFQGTNWFVTKTTSYNTDLQAIVDGVEYVVPKTCLSRNDIQKIDSISGSVYFVFGVGELSLAASREQLNVDQKTIDKIHDRVEAMFEGLMQAVQDKVAQAPTLLDAFLTRQECLAHYRTYISFPDMKWKEFVIKDTNRNAIFCNHNNLTFYRNFRKGKEKLQNSTGSQVPFAKNLDLYYDDLENNSSTINGRHIKKWLEAPERLRDDRLVIIFPGSDKEEFFADPLVEGLGIKKLSTIYTAPKVRKESGPRLMLYRVTSSSADLIKYSIYKESKSTKILLKLVQGFGKDKNFLYKGKELSINDQLSCLRALTEEHLEFYGVMNSVPQERIEEDLEDCIDLEEYLNDEVFTNSDVLERLHNHFNKQKMVSAMSNLFASKGFESTFTTMPDSPFKTALEPYLVLRSKRVDKISEILSLFQAFNREELYSLEQREEDDSATTMNFLFERYPLIRYLTNDRFNANLAEFLPYLAMMDSQQKAIVLHDQS